jgi:Tfp pilus assembly protein PilF
VIDSVKELPDYPSRTLYTTWDLSFMQIKQQNARAANLLRFLAYLDHQDIWYEFLHGGQGGDQSPWFTELASDEFVFEDAMQTLTRYCLVESHHQTRSYSLHMCVHDWTLTGLNTQIDTTQYWLAFDCLASHISLDDWDNLSALRYRRFVPHAVRLMHERFQKSQQELLQYKLTEMYVVARLLKEQVQYKAAERMYERALAGYEKALGPDHTSTLDTVNNLGILYRDRGKLAEAEQMYKRALAGKEKALGPDHTSTLKTVNNLGILYRDQGKLAEAEQMYERALAGKEKALGPDHTSTLDTVNNLGILYRDQGKLAEAKQMYERALAGYEKASLSHTIAALNVVRNLGVLYRDQAKKEQAKEMFQRAVLGRAKVLGPRHPHTLEVINYLRQLDVEVTENERQNTDVGHNPSRKRDRWKNILRLKSSKAGHT